MKINKKLPRLQSLKQIKSLQKPVGSEQQQKGKGASLGFSLKDAFAPNQLSAQTKQADANFVQSKTSAQTGGGFSISKKLREGLLGGPVMKVRADEPIPTPQQQGPKFPGGNGPIMKVRADEPLPGQGGIGQLPELSNGNGPIMKVRADEPLPGNGDGVGPLPDFSVGDGPIMKIRADEPLPGTGDGVGPLPDFSVGDGPIMKIRADEPLPGTGDGVGPLPDFSVGDGPIMKIRADEPLPGQSFPFDLSDLLKK